MRELYFKNSIGETFALNKEVLISSIEGLGIVKENTYFNYGAKSKKFSSTNPISEINLGLVFMEGYSGYLSFVDFIKRSKSLDLHYKAVDEKYAHVEVVELTKGQIEFGVLKSELRLDKLSGWLKRREIEIDISESGEDKKTYPFPYPHTYSQTSNGKIRLTNYGHIKAEMIIKIIGEVDHPQITISQFDEVVQTLRLNIAAEGIFEISSLSTDAYIKLDGESIYEHQDFTCTNFLTLPLGESEIEFRSGVPEQTSCTLLIFEEYEAN